MTKFKTKTFRQVRYFPTSNSYSQSVGFKGRLIEDIKEARAIVKRLKRAKIEAFHVPFKITVAA